MRLELCTRCTDHTVGPEAGVFWRFSTARRGSARRCSLFGGFHCGWFLVPGSFFSTASVEVPSRAEPILNVRECGILLNERLGVAPEQMCHVIRAARAPAESLQISLKMKSQLRFCLRCFPRSPFPHGRLWASLLSRLKVTPVMCRALRGFSSAVFYTRTGLRVERTGRALGIRPERGYVHGFSDVKLFLREGERKMASALRPS